MMNTPCRCTLAWLSMVIDFDDLKMIWDKKSAPVHVPPDCVPSPAGLPSSQTFLTNIVCLLAAASNNWLAS